MKMKKAVCLFLAALAVMTMGAPRFAEAATLKEIEADNIPVINVFNKCDLLEGDLEETRKLLAESDGKAN